MTTLTTVPLDPSAFALGEVGASVVEHLGRPALAFAGDVGSPIVRGVELVDGLLERGSPTRLVRPR
jgi:hypothetical protein